MEKGKSFIVHNKSTKGITLIALVVTIVVLLILAGVSINVLFGDSGLIKKAGDAQERADRATKDELDSFDALSELINEKTGALSKLKLYDNASKNDDGTVKENVKYKDSENNIAVIPNGYKVSDDENEKTISKGLVIKDAEENEFVWVPVKSVNEYVMTSWNGEKVKDVLKTTDDKTDLYYRAAEAISQLSKNETKIIKTAISGYKINAANSGISEIESIENYGGFYIGRYEVSYDSTNKKLETKKDRVPYTNIDLSVLGLIRDTEMAEEMSYFNGNEITTQMLGLAGASDNASGITNGYEVGIVTGLQWDAMIRWLNKTNSLNAYNLTGHKGTTTINTGTNEVYKVNNIYDIAGNVSEFVRNEYYGTDGNRVYRGANYSSDKLSADLRGNTNNIVSSTIGTRQSIIIGNYTTGENTSSDESNIRNTDSI